MLRLLRLTHSQHNPNAFFSSRTHMEERTTLTREESAWICSQQQVLQVEIQVDWTCAVCLSGNETSDSGGASENVVGLPCGHRFHNSCIRKWLHNGSARCPLCNWDTRCVFRKTASTISRNPADVGASGGAGGVADAVMRRPVSFAAVTLQARRRRMRRLPRCPTMLNVPGVFE